MFGSSSTAGPLYMAVKLGIRGRLCESPSVLACHGCAAGRNRHAGFSMPQEEESCRAAQLQLGERIQLRAGPTPTLAYWTGQHSTVQA